jgi:hypothetical protein
VHRRLVTEESYQVGDYETALKKAFLGTDEDLLVGEVVLSSKKILQFNRSSILQTLCIQEILQVVPLLLL